MAYIDNKTGTRNRRGALAFALCVIGVLQLSSAVHRFEHVAGYIEATCKVCIQLDRVDDTVQDHATSTNLFPETIRPVLRATSGIAGQAIDRRFDARAPPYL